MPADVKDGILIRAGAPVVFDHLTRAGPLARWWPKACESDPREGGVLRLTWFDDTVLETRFEVFRPHERVAFAFGEEHCSFEVEGLADDRSRVHVRHAGIRYAPDDLSAVIHVAQAWSALLVGLKVRIEHDRDVREPPA